MKTPTKPDAPRDDQQLDLRVAIAPNFRVDRAAGRLTGLAIMTGNREATGHGIYLDEGTIQTALASIQEDGGRMRGAITHGSILDFLRRGRDRVLEIPGYFEGVTKNGVELAGDFQFYESFRTQQAEAFTRLMEMAEKTPELFGLSAEPRGYAVFIDEDDNEYTATYDRDTGKFSGAPEGAKLKYDGMPVLRVTRLRVAAFVDEPAANDGLFAKLSSALRGFFGADSQPQLTRLRSLANAFLAWAETPDARAAFTFAAPDVTPRDQPTALADDDMKILLALKEKFGADQARHQRALALLSEDSTLTVEQIEAKLNEKPAAVVVPAPAEKTLSLADVTARFGADKARLVRAFAILSEKPESTLDQIDAELAQQDSAELARLRAENEKLQKQLSSGHPAPLNLGHGSGHGGAAPETRTEPFGLNRVTAAFAADPKNPANVAGRN